jgi:hypothetical protein
MRTNTPHGVRGCPCEDCLGARISKHADLAPRDRKIVPLWARQRRFRVRLATTEMLRSEQLTA